MAAMIWDPALGAWQEAEAPQAWDSSLQAYGGSTGLVYDAGAGAWAERWGSKKYLYKDGNEYTAVTGGWEDVQPSPEIESNAHGWIHELPTKGASSITLHPSDTKPSANTVHFASIGTVNKINLSAYGKLYVVGDFTWSDSPGQDGGVIMCNGTREPWEFTGVQAMARGYVVDKAGTYEVDISAVGVAYVIITFVRQGRFVIREIWLEK